MLKKNLMLGWARLSVIYPQVHTDEYYSRSQLPFAELKLKL